MSLTSFSLPYSPILLRNKPIAIRSKSNTFFISRNLESHITSKIGARCVNIYANALLYSHLLVQFPVNLSAQFPRLHCRVQ